MLVEPMRSPGIYGIKIFLILFILSKLALVLLSHAVMPLHLSCNIPTLSFFKLFMYMAKSVYAFVPIGIYKEFL
jgi:hypothetical protein